MGLRTPSSGVDSMPENLPFALTGQRELRKLNGLLWICPTLGQYGPKNRLKRPQNKPRTGGWMNKRCGACDRPLADSVRDYCDDKCKRDAAYGRERLAKGAKTRRKRRLRTIPRGGVRNGP